MGMIGRKIVTDAGLDVEEVIRLLNQAFSDEWLAYYQYWVGAQIVCGLMAATLRPELEEHANEELDHAQKLAKRIIELGGTPVLSPEEWYKQSTCGYLEPKNHDAVQVLKQNLQAERCAIEVYNKLLKYVFNKDMITAHIVRQILQDEIEHEQELEDLGKDYEVMLPDHTSCGCKKK
ncbi:ferritin-like domain-containing protein [Candidatus Avelusimicrobium luingense]|uniref:ferritin-like domain-containing protein n=1 Tax=Candidatus Avelusimicrobium luingense TaxID=3416211 RepID=UPI003D0A439A